MAFLLGRKNMVLLIIHTRKGRIFYHILGVGVDD